MSLSVPAAPGGICPMVALPRPRSATAGILRQVGGFDQPGLEVSKDIHTIMRTRDPRMWKVSMSDLSDFPEPILSVPLSTFLSPCVLKSLSRAYSSYGKR